MGLEAMRGGYGRCPPLIVGGLIVISVLLTFNWWSLSSQNYELMKQLDDIGEQLRRCSDERDQSIQLRLSVEGRLKSTEEELAQLRVRLEQQEINADDTKKLLEEKDSETKKITKELDDAKKSFSMCATELESLKKVDISKDDVIASLKIEKEGMIMQRDDLKREVNKLTQEKAKAVSDLAKLTENQAAALARSSWVKPSMQSSMKVQIHDRGLHGIIGHTEPILPRDPPNAFRPAPRFSVTNFTRAAAAANAPIAESKSNAPAKPDLNADEKDEDNAKERGDDTNVNDAAEPDDERFDQNKEDNDVNEAPEETAPKDSVDQMAQAIEDQDKGNDPVAQAAPPPNAAAAA